jgi:hypothetical protein
MSFLLDNQISEDKKLNEILKNVFKKVEKLGPLLIYNLEIKIYYAESLKYDKEIEVRAATEIEHYMGDIDLVILISQMADNSPEYLEYLIAKELLRVKCEFVGQEGRPAIFINKYDYNLMVDAIKNFNGYLGPDTTIIDELDNMDFGSLPRVVKKPRGMLGKGERMRNGLL